MGFALPLAFAGSSLLQAGGSIWSSMIQSNAAKEASAAMMDANFRADQTLRDQQAMALGVLAPFLQIGRQAGDTLSYMTVSPTERKRQNALEQARLQSEVQRLSAQTPWDTFPIFTGKNASERRASAYTEQEHNRMTQLQEAQAKLDAFSKQMQVESQFTDQPMEESPYYAWQKEQGTKYLERSLSKKGLAKSGEGVKLLGDFVRGLGAEESARQYDRLLGLYTPGVNAAMGSANLISAFAPQIAGNQVEAGRARAAGITGAGEATANMISGVTNAVTSGVGGYLQYDQFNQLINRNKMLPAGRGRDPLYDAR